jgi:DnaJ-class molecular chaperone
MDYEAEMTELGRAYCPKCDGEGLVYDLWHLNGEEPQEKTCPTCRGLGWVPAEFPVAKD